MAALLWVADGRFDSMIRVSNTTRPRKSTRQDSPQEMSRCPVLKDGGGVRPYPGEILRHRWQSEAALAPSGGCSGQADWPSPGLGSTFRRYASSPLIQSSRGGVKIS